MSVNTACGSFGSTCRDCGSLGQGCGVFSGQCSTGGSQAIGGACRSDHDCALGANSARPICLPDDGTWWNGHCTDLCNSAVPCPTGMLCDRAIDGDLGRCRVSCNTAGSLTECNRTENTYACLKFANGVGVCQPVCRSNAECNGGRCEAGVCCGLRNCRCCQGSPQCAEGTCLGTGFCG